MSWKFKVGKDFLQIPVFQQSQGNSCSVASTIMVLFYGSGIYQRPEGIIKALGEEFGQKGKNGSRRGLEERSEKLLEYLSEMQAGEYEWIEHGIETKVQSTHRRNPAILDLWLDVGAHSVVAMGKTGTLGRIMVLDPFSGSIGSFGLQDFPDVEIEFDNDSDEDYKATVKLMCHRKTIPTTFPKPGSI